METERRDCFYSMRYTNVISLFLVSVREKENSQSRSDGSWVEVSRESADDNTVGSVGSANSSP